MSCWVKVVGGRCSLLLLYVFPLRGSISLLSRVLWSLLRDVHCWILNMEKLEDRRAVR